MKWIWVLDEQPEDHSKILMCWQHSNQDWTICFVTLGECNWEKTLGEAFHPYWWMYIKDFEWPNSRKIR